MNIRTATLNDLDAVTAVEAACFPAAEAASKRGICRAAAVLRQPLLAHV